MVTVSNSYSAWNISALYADMQGARRAIDALQNDGVEANSIALTGEGADAARRIANGSRNTNASDAPILGRVIWRCVLWSIVGAILGAGVGFVLGLSGLTFPGVSNNMAIQIASWAMFLHVGGALWGAYAGISNGSAWALTFQPIGSEGGRVFVNVAASNEHDSHRAERILRSKAAVVITRAGRIAATDDPATDASAPAT